MVLGRHGRSFSRRAFGPIARALVRAGISPDVVTVTGTVLTAAISFGLLARGHLVSGPLLLGVVLLTDSIDGIMAREMGRESKWGAFLDSTMDRFGDASIYAAITIHSLTIPGPLGTWTFGFALALLPLALIVSYARARAEAVNYEASVGIAERVDRLVVSLLGCLLVGLGLPDWVLTIAVGYAAVASFITVIQRMYAVYRQDREVRHAG
ncbi:MAG TPA: CDP-alcohol phosphatidyltransferase family protein [Actinomycetaceae bacterium]|nr:CDP-alcohol phosphatidyltransferase family protein [Actinomycetaceae bacterium]